jgi:predicted nucleic acid-binding protein
MGTQAGEPLFLDTNILVTATDESRRNHRIARKLIERGRAVGLHGALSGQIIREYLVVATRPVAANGLGMSPGDALRNVEQFAGRLAFCDETEATSVRLRGLVRIHGLAGKSTHDANVVATMACHGIARLVTENPEDFSRFPEVRLVGLVDLEESLTEGRRQE